jgi:hypothetical protein
MIENKVFCDVCGKKIGNDKGYLRVEFWDRKVVFCKTLFKINDICRLCEWALKRALKKAYNQKIKDLKNAKF